jgi:ureidoglycolate hydrolase
MRRVLPLRVEPLTEAAFRPFGQVLGALDRPPDYRGGGGSVPLDGAPAVVAVAPPTDPADREAIPAPETVRAFLIDGTRGYLLDRGTWHSIDRFPLAPPATTFVVLNEQETVEDLARAYAGQGGFERSQEVDYQARFGVTFELVP